VKDVFRPATAAPSRWRQLEYRSEVELATEKCRAVQVARIVENKAALRRIPVFAPSEAVDGVLGPV
jgi:hypothetical protein